MKRYVLNYNSSEMEITESETPFTSKNGVFFALPNDTEVFITKDCINEMYDLSDQMDNDYEDVSAAEKVSPTEGGEDFADDAASFEKDGR